LKSVQFQTDQKQRNSLGTYYQTGQVSIARHVPLQDNTTQHNTTKSTITRCNNRKKYVYKWWTISDVNWILYL